MAIYIINTVLLFLHFFFSCFDRFFEAVLDGTKKIISHDVELRIAGSVWDYCAFLSVLILE